MPETVIKKLISSGKDVPNTMATLIEEEAERHILLRALQAGDGVKIEVIDLDGRGNTQDRVIQISSTADLLQGPPGPQGPAGDGTTGNNLGDGYQLFVDKNGLNLNLRSLKAGPGIKLTQNLQTITIEALPTTLSLLPVSNGGTGLSSIDSNALLVGNGTNALKKLVPTQAGSTPYYNGSDVVWDRKLIPIVVNIEFDVQQRVIGVNSPTPDVSCTILTQSSFSFTHPYTGKIPMTVTAQGLNSSGKWLGRPFTSAFRYEFDNTNTITVVGAISSIFGAGAPGQGRMIFFLDTI